MIRQREPKDHVTECVPKRESDTARYYAEMAAEAALDTVDLHARVKEMYEIIIEHGGELSLSTVAYSGEYSDLLSLPTLFSGDYDDLTNKPELFSGSYDDLTDKPTLFSGSYNDLSDKPSIYTQAQLYTKDEIDDMIGDVESILAELIGGAS